MFELYGHRIKKFFSINEKNFEKPLDFSKSCGMMCVASGKRDPQVSRHFYGGDFI